MKHKLFAIVISLALIVTMVLPGTLAIAADQDSSTGETAPTVEIPVTEEKPVENTGAAPVIAPAECSCGTETEVHCEGCPLYIAAVPADPVKACTCGTEDDIHTEGCPLYVKAEEVPSVTVGTPSDAEKPGVTTGSPECTCDPKPAEGEAHKEGCPLYVAPELDIAELYSRLMAMQTQEEIVLVLMELSPETIAEFTDEQAAAIEAHYDSLSTTAAVSGDTMTPGDETVVGSSEVRYLTYDFTDAAPFMDPVEGGN